jgi:methyltransferase (TIGR00027 family)
MLEATKPSRTALGVGICRASHQLYDAAPLVFEDPVTVPILGDLYGAAMDAYAAEMQEGSSLGLRARILMRSRYAEDKLADAVARGVKQYVLLGAGLDTFAHRNPHDELRVFEVDHPATQRWKRELLERNQMPEPLRLRYVPVDFERQSLAQELEAGGLDLASLTVFAMLGVVLYLTHTAFRATLDFIASLPEGSGVIFDYNGPRHVLEPHEVAARDRLAAQVQELGEPFRLFFTPEEMAAELTAFRVVEDLGREQLNARYFTSRADELRLVGSAGRMLSAWR